MLRGKGKEKISDWAREILAAVTIHDFISHFDSQLQRVFCLHFPFADGGWSKVRAKRIQWKIPWSESFPRVTFRCKKKQQNHRQFFVRTERKLRQHSVLGPAFCNKLRTRTLQIKIRILQAGYQGDNPKLKEIDTGEANVQEGNRKIRIGAHFDTLRRTELQWPEPAILIWTPNIPMRNSAEYW